MIGLVMITGSGPLRFVYLFVLFRDSAIRRSDMAYTKQQFGRHYDLRKLRKYPSLHWFWNWSLSEG